MLSATRCTGLAKVSRLHVDRRFDPQVGVYGDVGQFQEHNTFQDAMALSVMAGSPTGAKTSGVI
jgi:hypothetical protein